MDTPIAGIRLRELTAADADAYHALLRANADHLTRHGDYRDEVRAGPGDVREALADRADPPLRFGVLDRDRLIGRVDLVAVDPPRYGLGYWLAEQATGRGIATAAVATVLGYARTGLHATDVFAGVTHGNDRSAALLHRLGFTVVAEFGTYRRFHLPMSQSHTCTSGA